MIKIHLSLLFCIFFHSSSLFSQDLAENSHHLAAGSVEKVNPTILFEMKSEPDGTKLPGAGKILSVLSVVTVVAFFAIFLLKRFAYGEKKVFADTSVIKVTASKKLSVKSTIHYVEIEGMRYVVVERDSAIAISEHLLKDEKDNIS